MLCTYAQHGRHVVKLLTGSVGRPCYAQQYNDWHWVDNGRYKSEQRDVWVYAGKQLAPTTSKPHSVVRLIFFSFVSTSSSSVLALRIVKLHPSMPWHLLKRPQSKPTVDAAVIFCPVATRRPRPTCRATPILTRATRHRPVLLRSLGMPSLCSSVTHGLCIPGSVSDKFLNAVVIVIVVLIVGPKNKHLVVKQFCLSTALYNGFSSGTWPSLE